MRYHLFILPTPGSSFYRKREKMNVYLILIKISNFFFIYNINVKSSMVKSFRESTEFRTYKSHSPFSQEILNQHQKSYIALNNFFITNYLMKTITVYLFSFSTLFQKKIQFQVFRQMNLQAMYLYTLYVT